MINEASVATKIMLQDRREHSPALQLGFDTNMKAVYPDWVHASDWLKHFTYLAAQQRSWTEHSLPRLGLAMRNLIAVAGKVTPDVASALKTMIQIR